MNKGYEVVINTKSVLDIVLNSGVGLFTAQEWKRLISPYTPRRERILEDTALIRPFEIEYIQPYSSYVYHGTEFNFRKESNPYATYEWDKAAAAAGQKDKLYRAINKYLKLIKNN